MKRKWYGKDKKACRRNLPAFTGYKAHSFAKLCSMALVQPEALIILSPTQDGPPKPCPYSWQYV